MKICDTTIGQDMFMHGLIGGALRQPVPYSVHGHDGGHSVMNGPDGAFCVPGDDDARAGG